MTVCFKDFWPGFDASSNFILDALKENCQIEIVDKTPDILFFSDFGTENFQYNKCKRVYITGENKSLRRYYFDYSIGWRYNPKSNHFRLPLHIIYILYRPLWKEIIADTQFLQNRFEKWRAKPKCCCMVVSNDKNKLRNDFFKKMSEYLPIDSGGRLFNNVGGPVEDKMRFINDYKFVLSFENSSNEGYTTEKILEPLMQSSIPIYWGNIRIGEDITTSTFININDFKGAEEVANFIKELIADEFKARRFFLDHFLSKDATPKIFERELAQFLNYIISQPLRTKNNSIKLIKVKTQRIIDRFNKRIKINSEAFRHNP